jgi:hypothetical protein
MATIKLESPLSKFQSFTEYKISQNKREETKNRIHKNRCIALKR